MISKQWRVGLRWFGRILLYLGIAIYMLVLYEKLDSINSNLDSIQSDVSSIAADVSDIAGGSCNNDRICP